MIRESNPFARGFRTMEQGFNEEDRQNMVVPNFMMRRQGLKLQRQGMQNSNDRANRAYNLDLQKFNFSKNMAMEKIREFEITQQRMSDSGGLTPYQKAQLDQQKQNAKLRGEPMPESTPDGLMGSYVKNTDASKRAANAIQSMPLLTDSLDSIYKGISSSLSAGGDVSRTLDAIQSYATGGKISKSQEQLLAKSGISLDSITTATESLQNVMNLPKIEATYQDMRQMFSPRKGDNLSTIHARFQETFNKAKKKDAYAHFYEDHGIPADDAGQGTKAQNNYINQYMNTNQYGSMFEQWLPDSSASPASGGTSAGANVTSVGSSSPSSGVSDDDVKNMMLEMSKKGHPITHEQAAQMIIALKGDGS